MIRSSALAAFALTLAAPTLPAPPTGNTCPPGSTQQTRTFVNVFGPELGQWPLQTLVVPKAPEFPGSQLVLAEVSFCGRVTGQATYVNLDTDVACTFDFSAFATVDAAVGDPAAPEALQDDLGIEVSYTSAPITLGPGESGRIAYDSGAQCIPGDPLTFTPDDGDFDWFRARPGDDLIIVDHAGVGQTENSACPAVDFSAVSFTELILRVEYTYCSEPNTRPFCNAGLNLELECTGGVQVIPLDGTGSFDPEGTPLSFMWSTDCPNAFIDEPTSPTPNLVIDLTETGCDFSCFVYLSVSDGAIVSDCRISVTFFPLPPGELFFCTQTQGGWGTGCNGNNPGCLRDMYFDLAFPNGLVVGDQDGVDGDDRYALVLTSSQAVEDFLPSGGPPAALTQDTTDPSSTPAGVFAAQLVAATLNVGFDAVGVGLCTLTNSCDFPNPPGTLATLVYVDGCVAGPLVGLSVAEVIALANEAISGGDLPPGVSYSQLSEALTTLNEEFVDCGMGSGCLAFP